MTTIYAAPTIRFCPVCGAVRGKIDTPCRRCGWHWRPEDWAAFILKAKEPPNDTNDTRP